MPDRISPTVGKRCALVAMVGPGADPLARTPRGTIIARHQGNYTVKLETVTDHVVAWCRSHQYPLSSDGRVQCGPGRVRIIATPPEDAVAAEHGLLSAAQTAARLGISRRRVLKLCADGRFPGASQMGQVWLIPSADVEEFEPNPPGNPNWIRPAPDGAGPGSTS